MTGKGARAFVLVNLLIALGLLGAFAVVATHTLRLAVRTSSSAAIEQDVATRLDQAVGVLRNDVWQAKKLDVSDQSTLRVTAAGDKPVVWTAEKDGSVLRKEAKDERRWNGLGLSFDREGSLVVVRRDGGEVALLRRAGGGGR